MMNEMEKTSHIQTFLQNLPPTADSKQIGAGDSAIPVRFM